MTVDVCFDPEELASWCNGTWTRIPRAPLSAVVHDSQKIIPGSLFVAIRGAHFDGHDFVGQAGKAGAAAALVRRARAGDLAGLGLPLLAVDDTALALRDLATGYRLKLGLTVVGVTGSVGKTTVKEMIACLLESSMTTARTKGNWNNEIGLPLSILAIPPGTKVGVLELGISHPGEMTPLCAIARPDWGVITTVGPVHLEFFDSVSAIADEKGTLLSCLPAGGTAVLSLDEPHFEHLSRVSPGRVITVSLHPEKKADYVLIREDRCSGECEVADRVDGGIHAFRLPAPGEHNRHNALLALAVARGLGVTWDALADAFTRYVAPAMRWERQEAGGLTFINDAYNANPVSMTAALKTFDEMDVAGRKWLVLGDMLELGAGGVDAHRAIGRIVAGGVWAGLVTVGELGSWISEGARAAGMPAARVNVCESVAQAVTVLKEKVVKGDALLIKASRGIRLETVISAMRDGMGKDC